MDHLLTHRDARGVCTLTLNRPDRHNAFDAPLIEALTAALQDLDSDPDVRVVILTGTGASFCSGADLQWMQAAATYGAAENRADAEQLACLMRGWSTLGKPTIARIQGPAYGGGLGLIAASDIAIASTDAVFAFSEVRLGLVPAVIAPYVLQAIGARGAKRWLLSAERFSSAEALRMGLVHEVVAPQRLDEAVSVQVEHLLKGGPQALAECKALIRRLSAVTVDLDLPGWIARIRASPEGREGIAAFLEKRSPQWRRNDEA